MSEPCVHSFVFDDCLSCQQSALVRCDKELASLRAERDALRRRVAEQDAALARWARIDIENGDRLRSVVMASQAIPASDPEREEWEAEQVDQEKRNERQRAGF